MTDATRIKLSLLFTAIICLALAMFVSGCTSTHIKAGRYEFSRISFCQSIDVEVVGDCDGNVKVRYGNDGGARTTGEAVKAAGIVAGMAIP